MVVNVRTYEYEKKNFFEKHNYDFHCETSSMDEYGRYHKEYIFEDGSIWYEVMGPVFVSQEVTVKECTMNVEFKMFQTEFWNSENSNSKFYYEKF